jgi:hypothetical protein
MIGFKIKQNKHFLDEAIVRTDVLAVDVERFESNVTNMKQFHTKYENNLKFMSTISRFDPEICLLECYKFELGEEWKPFNGLLLNLSCNYHQTNLPMCAYMLFGGMSRRGLTESQPIVSMEEQKEILSEPELEIRRIRDKRKNRFMGHYYKHNTFTASIQSSPEALKPRDEQIKLI